jgi:hypothetical protein
MGPISSADSITTIGQQTFANGKPLTASRKLKTLWSMGASIDNR